ncbi:MAG: peptide chain release factor N(5)-glutamine methyltransferase [Rhodobacterales bacterium]
MEETCYNLFIFGRERLKEVGISNSARESKKLLAFVTNHEYSALNWMQEFKISKEIKFKFIDLIEKRVSGAPISKIIGKRLFFNSEFFVNENVLDPRPETEVVVSVALEKNFSNVLDLGTGTGCIVISLLKERPDVIGVSVDISKECLNVAKINAETNGVLDRVKFIHSDWFSNVTSRFDLIVSNPPYIGLSELNDLSREVKNFDPKVALFGGRDGLNCYEAIFNDVSRFLNPGGRLITEVGYAQSSIVKKFFLNSGFIDIKVTKDLEFNNRVVSGHLPL